MKFSIVSAGIDLTLNHKKLTFIVRRSLSALFGSILLILSGCEFENPADFELPTWFVDIEFPLIHETYTVNDIVDSVTIFPHDSSGMQIIFEDSLPRVEIDASYLDVNFPGGYLEIQVPPTPMNIEYDMPAFVLDTTLVIPVTIPGLTLIDTADNIFTIPLTGDHVLSSDNWNQWIADVFNSSFNPIEFLVEVYDETDIPLPDDPAVIDEVTALILQDSPSSYFQTSIRNAGITTSVRNAGVELITGNTLPMDDTLAIHNENTSIVHNTRSVENTSLSSAPIKSWMAFNMDLSVEPASDFVEMSSGDSLFIELRIQLSIPGVDSAVVQILPTDITPELDPIEFPSEIEIFKGVFAGGASIPPNVNRLTVTDLQNNYPFDIDFYMDFQNIFSSDGEEIKIDTILSKGVPHQYSFDLKSDTIRSTLYPVSPLTELGMDLSASLVAQTATIQLDGSNIGDFSMTVRLYDQQFESLEAMLVEAFPTSQQTIEDIPQGLDGMAFTDVSIEFEMINTILAPVSLDMNLVGYPQFNDSVSVQISSIIDTTGIALYDSSKTIIRVHKDGTTTYLFTAPTDSLPSDSIVQSVGEGHSIVDLLSANPARMVVDVDARIDGRTVVEAGTYIYGYYRLHAPFEVELAPMVFIPAGASYVADMDHDTRNRIRSSLYGAVLEANVINTIPIGGSVSLLFSNMDYFPMDTTAEMLAVLRDSLVIADDWNPADEIYIIDSCRTLDPEVGGIYIFNTMSDYSECIDGLYYLVKRSSSGIDTVISYVDTLMNFILPDPINEQSDTSFTFEVDTDRIRLFTDIGGHYVMPSFHLNGTNGQSVYLKMEDYVDIQSSLIMQISSTGMLEEPPDELIVTYPNGGEILSVSTPHIIQWKTLGSISTISIEYGEGANPEWIEIASDIPNNDSLQWIPGTYTISDSLRIRVSGEGVEDVSGWYFSIVSGSLMKTATTDDVFQKESRLDTDWNRRVK